MHIKQCLGAENPVSSRERGPPSVSSGPEFQLAARPAHQSRDQLVCADLAQAPGAGVDDDRLDGLQVGGAGHDQVAGGASAASGALAVTVEPDGTVYGPLPMIRAR